MGNFKRLMTKYQVEYADFEKWLHKGQKEGGQVKRLDDAYERSLRKVEIAGMELEVWIARHIDDEFFDVAVLIKRKYIERLQAISLARLERLFERYRKDKQNK